jgi:hypothetical protein
MKKLWMAAPIALGLLLGCSEPEQEVTVEEVANENLLQGTWIKEATGEIMIDPQTSGLTAWRGQLASISDGSANADQARRIHLLDPASATLAPRPSAMTMSSRVRRSCFAQYLADEPDLEALVADPDDDTVFYIVTEDASRSGALTPRCQQQFEKTGSTDYPTLLLRVKLQEDGSATMTHVRPLQYPLPLGVGDFPNDGIEGLTMDTKRTLYMALEKDKQGQPRIFSVKLNDDFWQEQGFAIVEDPHVVLPVFHSGNHPINALDYYQSKNGQEYLFAMARNDNELWIIDLGNQSVTHRLNLQFAATNEGAEDECGATEIMDNASIEGIAVLDNTLWLVNDPWKVNYKKNIQCPVNAPRYEAMAPLLFKMDIDSAWFE